MTKQETYDLIEAYLEGTMTAQSKLAFEQSLQNDKALKAEFDFHNDLHNELSDKSLHDFRSKIKAADRQTDTSTVANKKDPSPVVSIRKYKWIGLAASIAALAICFQYFGNVNPSNTDLFASNFEAYEMVLNQRSGDSASLLNQAILQYETGDFDQAAKDFSSLQKEEENLSYQFYEAIALLGSNKTKEAKHLFNSILKEDNHLLTEQSEWYLALTHIQLNEIVNAKALLNTFSNTHYKYSEAQELIKNL